MKVRKRDGRVVDFDKKKIYNAIMAAMKETGDVNERTAKRIANEIFKLDREIIDIEEVQNLVEAKLMASSHKEVAKNYILYRDERARIRAKKSTLIREVGEKLSALNVQNQNANIDERSFGGRMGEASSALTKTFALDCDMSEKARLNHILNRIYSHDLNSFSVGMHNCLTLPFDKLLAEGFDTRQTDIRPANSINTAFQLVAVLFQLQSLQQFGGVSASHLDWTMVPYVRKSFYKHYCDGVKYISKKDYFWIPGSIGDQKITQDKWKQMSDFMCEYFTIDDTYGYSDTDAYEYAMDMTKKELQQAVEGLYHNLNTLQSRSGNQLPFTSINYGTCTLPEGRLVIKALLEGSIKGVGKLGRTPIFPCGIFQCMKGVNLYKGDPNYDLFLLAVQSTAKRLYPNYANVDWSGNAGYDRDNPATYFSTMGCRTANGYDINAEPGQNPQLKDGRGNICPVTIIMPTLAMEAKEKLDETYGKDNYDTDELIWAFMEILDTAIHDAKDILIERFEHIASQDVSSARFMYENGTMFGYKPEEGIRSALKHGTLAVG